MKTKIQSSGGGFTLVEIMVAIVVFSMVLASIYATWALVLRSTQIGQDAAKQAQRQRVVLRSIGDALMGIESFQASQRYYWFKLGNGESSYLSFVARLPDTYGRSTKFVSETVGYTASARRVTFSLEAAKDGEKNLVLRQQPILMDMDDDEKQFPLVLAENVKQFKVEWWGTNNLNEASWSDEWDDTMTNNIPQMLRIHLVIGANTEKGKDAPDYAATRIYTVPSQMMPAYVQLGVGNQGGQANPGSGLVIPPPAPPPNNGGQR